MKISLIFLILVFAVFGYSQKEEKCACSKKDKVTVRQFFKELETQNKEIAGCNFQNSQFNQIEIAGRCEWGGNGCPVNLVKPALSESARKINLSGNAKIETIVNESGNVIYAKMLEGNRIFKKAAEHAACQSKFTPFIFCGKKYKQKFIIEYNFTAK